MTLTSAQQPQLLQIVPALGGGVRDFADCLSREWALAGWPSQLLALDEKQVRARSLAAQLHARVAAPQGDCALLLHFSGYGYERRGLCLWLLRELRQARSVWGSRLHIVVMFHELFASGPPWRSAFWLGAAQAFIARQISRNADVLWTNSDHHAIWLRQGLPQAVPIHVSPVFSTVGEPADLKPLADRCQSVVVFGSPSTRQRAFDRVARHVDELRALGVTEIVEVGTGERSDFVAQRLAHRHAGALSTEALSTLLQSHCFGLIDYPSIHLGKSTVFAAYAVNGCVVLNTAPPGDDADELRCGHHYITLGQAKVHAPPRTSADEMTRAARAWYRKHPLRCQASAFLALLLRHANELSAPAGAALSSSARHG